MIVLGYKINNVYKTFDEDELDMLDGFAGDVELFTGYSVGCYEPEAAVFGIKMESTSALFNPISLADLRLTPTDAENNELAEAYDILSDEVQSRFDSELSVMIFEDTDD